MEELRWKTSVFATSLHAAACYARGIPAADATRFADLEGPTRALIDEIAAVGWPVHNVLSGLASLGLDIGSKRELVERLSVRLQLPDTDAVSKVRIAGAISDLDASLARSQPDIVEELAARVRPIREQWEARGPGLLAEVSRLTDSMVIPAAAEVVLVRPYAGGHGVAHPAQNRVVFEAVLVNPLPELPETLRLAWLLAQLNFDLPALADVLPPRTISQTSALAMLPAVLSAGEAVELGRCDASSMALALSAWHLERDGQQVAEKLCSWWGAWSEQRAKWPVAVAALQQLIDTA